MYNGLGQFGLCYYGNYLAGDATSLGDAADWAQIENNNITSDNGAVRNTWNAAYQGILRANLVLEKVPAIQMDANLKKEY